VKRILAVAIALLRAFVTVAAAQHRRSSQHNNSVFFTLTKKPELFLDRSSI